MTHPKNQVRHPRHSAHHLAATSLALGAVLALLGGVSPSNAAARHATAPLGVSALKTKNFGTILVSGRTVYTLQPSKTRCRTTCLKYWPEVLLPKGATRAIAGRGVSAAKLGTIARAGGRRQVTYAGRALYWFGGDTTPGQVKGNVTDTWGKWSVVVLIKPSGTGVPTTTTTAAGGGGGGIGF